MVVVGVLVNWARVVVIGQMEVMVYNFLYLVQILIMQVVEVGQIIELIVQVLEVQQLVMVDLVVEDRVVEVKVMVKQMLVLVLVYQVQQILEVVVVVGHIFLLLEAEDRVEQVVQVLLLSGI
jgi:hypothetical protein